MCSLTAISLRWHNPIMYLSFLHLIYQVNDIHAAVADVKAKNIRCLSAEPRIGRYFEQQAIQANESVTTRDCY